MKYPDFVAKTEQVNTPPGSYDTVKTWIREGFITKDSNVLEIGCNTGFISYQIHSYTKARVTGIDISEEAIKRARNYCKDYKNIKFLIASAEKIPFKDETFTHVILGGHLPWVEQEKRKQHVQEAVRCLKTSGFLLTSLYYFAKKPPQKFVFSLNLTFNMKLKPDDCYEKWSEIFNLDELTVEYEKHYRVNPPDKKRKEIYLSKFKKLKKELQDEWRRKVNLFEKNANYIQFFVRVARKIRQNDPYLQIPRGGIYTWEEI